MRPRIDPELTRRARELRNNPRRPNWRYGIASHVIGRPSPDNSSCRRSSSIWPAERQSSVLSSTAASTLNRRKRMLAERHFCSAKDGGSSDYELSRLGVSFAFISPDRLLKDKDIIALGNTRLVLLHHPGHTKGSCSYMLDVKDDNRTYKVLIANIPTIITGRKFAEVKEYPSIREDYAYTVNAMKHLKFDIWVASHASQFNLHKKRMPGDPYNPEAFADRKGYDEALENIYKIFREK